MIFILEKGELRGDPLSLTFKFEDENVAYDKHVQRCEAMIKDLIVEYCWRKFLFLGEIARKKWLYIWI